MLEGAAAPVAGAMVVSAGPTPDSDDDEPLSAEAKEAQDVAQRDVGYYDRPWEWKAIAANARFIDHFHGSADDMVPVEEGRRIAEALGFAPHYTYHEEPGASHFMDRKCDMLVAAVKRRLKL